MYFWFFPFADIGSRLVLTFGRSSSGTGRKSNKSRNGERGSPTGRRGSNDERLSPLFLRPREILPVLGLCVQSPFGMRFLRGFGREGLVTGPRNGNGKKGGTRCGRWAIAKRRRWWTRFRLGRSLRRRGCVWARGFQFDPESETVVGAGGGVRV